MSDESWMLDACCLECRCCWGRRLGLGYWILDAGSAGVVGGVGWGLDTGYSMLAVPVLLGRRLGLGIQYPIDTGRSDLKPADQHPVSH
ncbi:MAG: hypothetical protein QF473_00410 [Planctomycetota bacterium]|nr:hypothetical protein [Planctomycetota bacterium]